MQRNQCCGTSFYSPSSARVEEVSAEEEEETVAQQTGVFNEEEMKEEVTSADSEAKVPPVESKNGKKTEGSSGGRGGGDAGGGGSKHSMVTWFVVLSLLGVWTSMAVVYFDIVDYDGVIGKLKAYDSDGDGDFDMDDAKVLLGLTKDGGGSANTESLEDVIDILAEEGSDWIFGFFTFLYDVVSLPVERGEGEENEGGATSSSSDDDDEVKGLPLDLQNQ